MTKRAFLAALTAGLLSACTTGIFYNGVRELSVSFIQPSEWDGEVFPAVQMCSGVGGAGSTPALFVANIPPETNVIILEINNLSNPALAVDGGLGSIGFYHDGSETATLLPVPGETGDLPSFAFEEKVNRANPAKPYAYLPPCFKTNSTYQATVKALKRTGSFDKQRSVLLGEGRIRLGTY